MHFKNSWGWKVAPGQGSALQWEASPEGTTKLFAARVHGLGAGRVSRNSRGTYCKILCMNISGETIWSFS